MQTQNVTSIRERGQAKRNIVLAVAFIALAAAAAWRFASQRQPLSVPAEQPQGHSMSMAPVLSPANSGTTDNLAKPLTIELAAEDLEKLQIRTARAVAGVVNSTLRLPGIVKTNEYQTVKVVSLVGGTIEQVYTNLGDRVIAGKVLARVFSTELAEAESEYISFLAELEAAQKKLSRTRKLVELGATSKQEEEEIEAEHSVHLAHMQAARERLKLLRLTEEQIIMLEQSKQISPYISVSAPIDGVILARGINPGLTISSGQELFTVSNLSSIWVMASTSEPDFTSVRVGSPVIVTASAYPGRSWKGRVEYIQPIVDASTRTAQARIPLGNSDERLRIDMYVDVEVSKSSQGNTVIPEAAIQSIGQRQFVFSPVPQSEGSYLLKPVRLGESANGTVNVIEGLQVGADVVTSGSFNLRSEAIRQHPDLR